MFYVQLKIPKPIRNNLLKKSSSSLIIIHIWRHAIYRNLTTYVIFILQVTTQSPNKMGRILHVVIIAPIVKIISASQVHKFPDIRHPSIQSTWKMRTQPTQTTSGFYIIAISIMNQELPQNVLCCVLPSTDWWWLWDKIGCKLRDEFGNKCSSYKKRDGVRQRKPSANLCFGLKNPVI